MKVFVGWPYDATWIRDYALPLIKTYDVDVVTGEEVHGQVLTQAVRELIEDADAAVFFTTRRGAEQNGKWGTSDWVVDEIKHANAHNMESVLEFREVGVDYPNKIYDPRQYYEFKPDDRLQCLVRLGQAISDFRRLNFMLKLQPEEFNKALLPRLPQGTYQCAYSLFRGSTKIKGPVNATIRKQGQGMYLYAQDIPAQYFAFPDAYLDVTVTLGGDQWWAAGISLNTQDVTLEKFST